VGACALTALTPRPATTQHADTAGLGALIDGLRIDWGIPGAAVAVVRNDSVLLARGFGVRDAAGGGAVDEHTLFAIGSTTKAFTATAVAALVGDGALHWDDRVVEHLPGFELSDPWLTDRLTIRDLLAHRSGLPMANFMWLTGQLGSEELIRRLRHLEAGPGFRSGLAYQNVLYLAAGRIVGRVAASTWPAFVAERLLQPLGMARTRTGVAGLDTVDNVASPHVRLDDGTPHRVPFRDIDAVGPAGAMLSSAADMASWLRFQLAEGSGLVSPAALAETHRPQTLIPIEGPLALLYPDARMLAYGMGWVVAQHRGLTFLDHSGGIDGMTSLVALIPERRMGVAILTNEQAAIPPYWMLHPLLDHLLGYEPRDYGGLRTLAEQAGGAADWGPARAADEAGARPLNDYVGEYPSAVIGSARVRLADGVLVLEAGRMAARLEPWHFETFRAAWTDAAWLSTAGPAWVTFRRDLTGRVQSLELSVSPGESWTFEKAGG
jgi:CubicO group peptidase (beta-lactamase class C family)